MSDQNTPVQDPQAAQPMFGIQRTYLKGISLEMPRGAETFVQQGNPHIDVNLGVSSAQLADGVFEVTLRGTLTGSIEGKTLFVLEADQAGIFEIRNIPEQDMPGLLEVSCPTILTPYLRAQVADVLARATLPVFHLPEINWMAMQQQRIVQEAQAPAGSTLVH